MGEHYRVIVIGGGVVGCSVLYHLTKRGWSDICLLERDVLTSGSTWHAAGGFHTLNGDPNVAKMQQYTVGLYKELEEKSGLSCGLHLTGGIQMAKTKERVEALKNTRARGRFLGMELEIVTPAEAKAQFPILDDRQFMAGLYDPIEGHLDPSGTTQAYAKCARMAGARIIEKTPVKEISQRPDGTWVLSTPSGEFTCEHVVNAGGLWAREVGRMVGLELPVLAMEHHYLLTETVPEVVEYNKATGKEVIHIIDFEGEIYTRQERDGILLGTYEQAATPWQPRQTPWDFGQELLQPNFDRIAPSLEIAFQHYPALANVGIRRAINGPFTFAPDGNPLVGPVQGLTNFWLACGVMAGFSQGGGVGLALSNWMVDNDPGFDIWAMDNARFGEWATRSYTNAKVRENYSRRFRIRFPNEELPAARPQQTTALYDIMLKQGAVMGDSWGLETPLWFAPEGVEPRDIVSFRRSNDFAHVKAEVMGVRNGVGVTEIANFAKYRFSGPGAEAWLGTMMTNRMPKTGRIVLTPMLNPNGKLIGDFTIAKADDQTFYMWGSSQAQKYHMRWFEQHLPGDGSVKIHRYDQGMVGLSIAGPKSRDVLALLTDEDVSNTGLRFMDHRAMDIANVPALINRVTYTGDLGYEIWVDPAYQRRLYEEIMKAGKAFGIVNFGMRALLSMRLEKNFPTWYRELRPIYGPFEAGMDRFIDLGKNHFIGREKAMEEKRDGGTLRRVSFVVEADDADVLGDEPVWHEGKVVGWITSGGYAHYVDRSLAQGYVPKEIAGDLREGGFEIEIIGERRRATIIAEPLFDPKGERMRS